MGLSKKGRDIVKVKGLKIYLENFTDDADVQLWQWVDYKDVISRLEPCCNTEYQIERNTVQLRIGFVEQALDNLHKQRRIRCQNTT